ncbi:cytochrome c biogenesis CcdA family protein [Mycolicibacterium pyrenivorans]|uniref:cytochrome c biogenesis CcdA family protein n=1 Tax=Mycolicibacterium pyrenivorans TaxID=187102 RepID=UPI0021F2B7C6|nr:cytochrome c biogenesis CcdA family protein [Mycolicibacterium pyrenivorans]MCV7151069.1 cytochrome c biogenesis protein CcdA [Mycolicibacterium pyrenivorans]
MMDSGTIAFAMAAGLVAALNPCGFALLPGYLALVVAGEGSASVSRVAAVGRALAATAMMAAGFLVVFGSFALILAPFTAVIQQYLPVFTVVIGAALLLLGAWMLSGREVTLLLPKSRSGAPTARLGSMFGYGMAYAVASLSCTIGPFLAVTGSTFRTGSVVEGLIAYLAYAAGMALLVGVLATAIALAAAPVTTWLRGATGYLTRIGGVLLVAAGAYVAYYGVYELRVIGGADASDPLIEAAARIQQVMSSAVGSAGILPIMGVLVVIIGAAGVFGWRRIVRRRRTADVER